MKLSRSKVFHQPVLKKEVIKYLKIKKGGRYIDATLGEGGHAEGILKKLGAKGYLLGIDWDEEATAKSKKRLAPFKEKIKIIKESYTALPDILKRLKIGKVDGILLDLGVSSLQLETPDRGFSFRLLGPLDMRMDKSLKRGADYFINSLSGDKLEELFIRFGEERYSKGIARQILRERMEKPIETTFELSRIIKKAIPKGKVNYRIHPSTRVFQALRIAVNRELDNIKSVLEGSIHCLKKNGRIAVISYHSLEDRIVKNFFRDLSKSCLCPPGLPVCRCGTNPQLKVVTRKPITPREGEILNNPRSRSAKLRLAEKL